MTGPSTTVVDAVLGSAGDAPWSARRHDPVDVAWGDATKHRRVVRTASGRELALRLPRGTFLADGAVLDDDGETAVVVRRPPEPAVVVPLDDRVRSALLLGYLLGNRHAPLDLDDDELRTPLLTSPGAAERMLTEIGVTGSVRDVPLAARGWAATSSDHAHSAERDRRHRAERDRRHRAEHDRRHRAEHDRRHRAEHDRRHRAEHDRQHRAEHAP